MLVNVWPGCNAKGLMTKADNLEVSWDSQDMIVEHKALLLSCAFLIDFMLFEKRESNDSGGDD